VARPSKLTPQVQATIVGALVQGLPFTHACSLADVSSSTAYEWLARGRGDDPRRPLTAECLEFAMALEAAGFADTSEQVENPANSGYGGLDAENPSAFADKADPGFSDTLKKTESETDEVSERAWISRREREKRGPLYGLMDTQF
jgi:hypothetical protein